MAARQCVAAREKSGLNIVCLSGGSFQNQYIMERLPKRLEQAGFRVLRHRRVSCNDEGLSLGQLMIAGAALEREQHVFGNSIEAHGA
jgi:hydrogenase maturation protein HypF